MTKLDQAKRAWDRINGEALPDVEADFQMQQIQALSLMDIAESLQRIAAKMEAA